MVPAPNGNLGQRLLPSLVDEIARNDPSRVLFSVTKTRDPADGFEDIDARTFSQAVDRCAWHLQNELGRGEGFPTLLYMGPQDVAYAILILASIKAGYKLLLSSPRNTLDAHLSLLDKTGCGTMLLLSNFPLPVIKQIESARKLKVVDIPPVTHWLNQDQPTEPYPYTKTYAEARLDPWVVLHTSGSTGIPKPIVQTHATYSAQDAFTGLPSLGYRPCFPSLGSGRRIYLGFPLFHCAGVFMLLPASLFAGFTIVLGPFPPSADVVNAVHVHGNVHESCVPPFTLIELSKDPTYLKNLRRLKTVTTGGGSVPKVVGDLISSKTRLLNVLGTTEAGVMPHELPDPEDWQYMKLSPALGHEYRKVSDDLYEHIIIRKPELYLYQGVFGTFPDLQEWPMKDLYSKHPTKEGLWLYRGRTDDIIVFSTGEKLNPVDMETIIQSHQAVTGAVIAGSERFQSSLLIETIEPPKDDSERERLLEEIWPTVEKANKESPSHGRLHRDMVLFTTADRPMPRAGKGTVIRQATLDLYSPEIEALYGTGRANTTGGSGAGQYSDAKDAARTIISRTTSIDLAKVPADANLFELGLDSLQVTAIVKEANKYLIELGRPSAMQVALVYRHPSLEALVSVFEALCKGQEAPEATSETDEEKMQTLYDLHTADLPINGRAPEPQEPGKACVLLTGSTGSLGSYILDSLVARADVARIYCLNRGTDSLGRQQKSQAAKGLASLPAGKVRCIDGADLFRAHLGLPVHEYKTLLSEVTLVVHNAWQVDFNQPLASFAVHVGGVRQLVNLAAHSRLGAAVLFVSSVGAVAEWAATNNTTAAVPEAVVEDWRAAQRSGYGQAKLVAERVLDAAARTAGVPAAICRAGQVAGPSLPVAGGGSGGSSSCWPRREWVPSLVASSKHLELLPGSLVGGDGVDDCVDWVPVDALGRIVVELGLGFLGGEQWQASLGGATVYHAVNPKVTSWEELAPVIAEAIGGVEVVPLESWVAALRESASKTEDVTVNPAVKIFDFYEGLVGGTGIHLDTTNTVERSTTLAELGPINGDMMKRWMEQWAF